MIIKFARPLVRLCHIFFGTMLILLAVFTLVARFGLPFVSDYKSSIEARVSDYLQSPVVIGELDMRWTGLGPILSAENVSVIESEQRQVTVDELLIDLDVLRSLIRGTPVINEMTLVGTDLAIETTRDGEVKMHGMETVPGRFSRRSPAASNESTSKGGGGVDLFAWLLNARKVGLLDTRLTFIDGQAEQSLVLDNVNIRAENVDDLHQLRIDLDLPASLGGGLEAGIDLEGSPRDLSTADGNIYIKSDTIKTLGWLELFSRTPLMPDNLFQLEHVSADVGFEVWGRWKQGHVDNIRGRFIASQLVDSRRDEPLLDEVTGDLTFRRGSDVVSLHADSLVFVRDSQRTSISDVTLNQSLDDRSVALTASGESLPLSLVSHLIASVTAEHKSGRLVKEAQPSGMLNDWQVAIDGIGADQTIDITATVQDLVIKPTSESPGFGPLNGSIDVVDGVGSATLAAIAMPFDWPRLFPDPQTTDSVKAKLDFDLRNRESMKISGLVNIEDDGIETETRLRVSVGKSRPLHLDVQSRYSVADLQSVTAWMPLNLMSEKAQTWFQNAFKGGTARNGSLLFFGRPSEFPFDEGEGVFRAGMDIENGAVEFKSDWPVITNVSGRLTFNGLRMTGMVETGRLDKFDISQARVDIDDLKNAEVRVDGSGSSKLPEMIQFANTGPLKQILEPALGSLITTGQADMDVVLSIPLKRQDESDAPQLSVNGSIFLNNNTVRVEPANIDLKKVRGAVNFDRYGVRINNLKARWLDHQVGINGKTRGRDEKAVTTLNVEGALRASDVLVHYESTLDQFVRGKSNWRAELSVPHSPEKLESTGISLTVDSDLIGTALLVPAPLSKSTASGENFRLTTNIVKDETQLSWNFDYSDSINGIFVLEEGKFKSLSIGLGGTKAIAQPDEGIRLDGSTRTASLGDWVDTINQYRESLPEPEPDDRDDIVPISGNLTTGALFAGDDNLGPARLRINSDDIYLNAVMDNEFLRGNIRYPRRLEEKEVSAKVRLNYIDNRVLAAFEKEEGEAEEEPIDPRELPPIEARISEVKWDSLRLRDINLKTRPDVLGLNIDTLGFAYRSMQLVGRGHWRLRDVQGINAALAGEHLTNLALTLQSDDFGSGLIDIGLPDLIAEGSGIVESRLSWDGPAYKPDLAMLGGTLKIDLERGRIMQLEPGAGRLFGLFAVQELPRRLGGDFKDLTADGLSFQRLTGDIEMTNGVADARLIQMTGPIGVVDIMGETDLLNQQFDSRITVLPRVSAALPIIGVIAGGASAGVGALLAGGLLKAVGLDLDRIGYREFSLTGTWEEPNFKSIPLSISVPDTRQW